MANFLFLENVRNIFFSVGNYLAFSVPEKVKLDSGMKGVLADVRDQRPVSTLSSLCAPLMATKLPEASITLDIFLLVTSI